MAHMTSDYRIQAIDSSGKPIEGVIRASSPADARKRAKTLAQERRATIVSVESKKRFIYRARKGDKVINGEQLAYVKEDVNAALRKVGFEIIYVRRKLFDFRFQLRVPVNELVSFLGVSAKLLEEKLAYTEVLQVMVTNVRHNGLKNAIREIIKDLKDGVDSRTAFTKQQRVFGKHVAMMLGIASQSGDMTEIFRTISQFAERDAEFRKSLYSALILPGVTMIALIAALGFYVLYLLPQMTKVFEVAKAPLPFLTRATLEFSVMLQDNITVILVTFVIAVLAFYRFVATEKGRELFDKWIILVPYFGRILHNTSIELFCRVLGIMYSSAGENIDTMSLAAEASRNRWIEKKIKTVAIPNMLQFGVELPIALEATKAFPEMALSRFRAGVETGNVKSTSTQIADFYQTENTYALKNFTDFLQIGISVIIMGAMVFLTFLSSETATISLNK